MARLAGVRENRGLLCVGALGAYGSVTTLQPDGDLGSILAAYGGVFVVGSLLWAMVADGFRPDRYDMVGVAACLVGVAVIMSPRVAASSTPSGGTTGAAPRRRTCGREARRACCQACRPARVACPCRSSRRPPSPPGRPRHAPQHANELLDRRRSPQPLRGPEHPARQPDRRGPVRERVPAVDQHLGDPRNRSRSASSGVPTSTSDTVASAPVKTRA